MRGAVRYIIQSFGLIERILRNRVEFFAETNRGDGLREIIGKLLTVTVIGFALVSLVASLGGQHLGRTILSVAKLPFVFLASGLICLPTLYYNSVLFGSRLRFLQTIALILTAQTVSATLTLGFMPISLLFWISGAEPVFLMVLNTGVMGLAAVLGLVFLIQGVLTIEDVQPRAEITWLTWLTMLIKGGFRSVVLMGWLLVYGLVGAQLSWVVRPFFGVSLSQYGDSFWSSMATLVSELLK